VLIIANPASHDALAAANYYRVARGVPDSNVLFIDPAAADFARFAEVNLRALFGTLEARGIGDHIDMILVMPGSDFAVDADGLVADLCPSPMTQFSVGSCYTMAFIADEVLSGTLQFSELNQYTAGANSPVWFDSSTAYLGGQPSGDPAARRYFIGAMLGYTGPNGNTLDEVLDMVDRSVAADGTRPAGTFYFMDNPADEARNVRASSFANAVTQLAGVGATGEILGGKLPVGRDDCLGIMAGFASSNLETADLTILPGAFCDHLTSYAATFDIDNQMKVSSWIRAGASGSVGTIEEPCNITGKFPKANTHPIYFQGMSLGEAAFRGLRYVPFQGLIYGDPLTRPFAYIPVVAVPDAPTGPVSGIMTLTPIASTSNPGAAIGSLELLVDGVLVDTAPQEGVLSVDTTGFDEGFHDLRVLAADDTGVRSVGRWVGSVEIDNGPGGATAGVNRTTGDLGTAFHVTVGGSGGLAIGARVWNAGRVVASSTGVPATVTVHGRVLGAGVSDLRVQTLFADGSSAWAAPVSVTVDDVDPGASGTPPVAYGYTRTVEPGASFVLELPASFDDALDAANWSVLSAPAQSSMLGGAGSYRVLEADADASGTDTLVFAVSTPSGSSGQATITIAYESAGCVADFAPPMGVLDFFDVQAFLNAYATHDPAADLAPPTGVFDFFDVSAFLASFSAGCP
jgi:hypothetical protein